ncbi:hypothetical protein V1477_020193 [Vespula maculifrons]|uniref:Uncharacterized protein n=1 Tax=Vespula maculifrons TaxID=7453 RepID=A0ABD2AL81_VESMC
MDLEIFTLPEDFENLSPRVDLEIFVDVIRAIINEDLKIESTLTRGSPNTATFTWWDLGRHDRSCLDMSEADGVDGGAICKRGFIHLQFAAKPEAPEAERHLGSRILE